MIKQGNQQWQRRMKSEGENGDEDCNRTLCGSDNMSNLCFLFTKFSYKEIWQSQGGKEREQDRERGGKLFSFVLKLITRMRSPLCIYTTDYGGGKCYSK